MPDVDNKKYRTPRLIQKPFWSGLAVSDSL